MKKNPKRKRREGPSRPAMKWQTGAYKQEAEFSFVLPYQFLLLCKLMEVTPREVLKDFMDNLSCSSWNREGRDRAKEHLINYFIAHGYGQGRYDEQDIRQMFREMDAVGLLFPVNGDAKMVRQYAKWRERHQVYWFEDWQRF